MDEESIISEKVIEVVSSIARINPDQLDVSDKLQDPPLRMNSQDIVFLTMAINQLIEDYNDNGPIPDSFVKNRNLTAQDLIDKVIEIINLP